MKGALCNYKPFQCSEEGFFPDPYDCKKYHVCLPIAVDGNDDLMTFECPEGTSYDALSASCGFPLTTDACINRP
ncbi:chitin binding peritrophin-A domain-containing protein, partial [Halalkalibacter flavus]|uniref:chitin binding peritrophin-A domain-containing protein n=1 Tax=Halalkalibacter flavus TaxID=3090668 RepID=UPI003D664438